MSDAATFNKTPEEIDIELHTAFSQRKSIRNSIIVLSFVLLILLTALYALVKANTTVFPRHKVVYTTNAEAVCAFTPIAERGNVSGALVENHASNLARQLHQLDYVNFRDDLSRVMDEHFTPDARAATSTEMLNSGLLRTVTRNGFVVRALPDERTVILKEGLTMRDTPNSPPEPVYTWVVKVSVKVAYVHRGEENIPTYRPETRDIYMTVIRTEPTAANPLGLLIDKLVSLQSDEEFDISSMTSGFLESDVLAN